MYTKVTKPELRFIPEFPVAFTIKKKINHVVTTQIGYDFFFKSAFLKGCIGLTEYSEDS